MKADFEEVLEAWSRAVRISQSVQEFRTTWAKFLQELGWTREEFSKELDRRNLQWAKGGQ